MNKNLHLHYLETNARTLIVSKWTSWKMSVSVTRLLFSTIYRVLCHCIRFATNLNFFRTLRTLLIENRYRTYRVRWPKRKYQSLPVSVFAKPNAQRLLLMWLCYFVVITYRRPPNRFRQNKTNAFYVLCDIYYHRIDKYYLVKFTRYGRPINQTAVISITYGANKTEIMNGRRNTRVISCRASHGRQVAVTGWFDNKNKLRWEIST